MLTGRVKCYGAMQDARPRHNRIVFYEEPHNMRETGLAMVAHLDPRSPITAILLGWASTASNFFFWGLFLFAVAAKTKKDNAMGCRKYPSSETHRRPVGYNHLWHGPGQRSATHTRTHWENVVRPSRERER